MGKFGIKNTIEEYQKKQRKEMTDKQLLTQMTEMKQKPSAAVQPHKKGSKSGIIVKGIDDVAVRFSKCCNPVPGDEIVGFITRGRGVSIHRTDCVNMLHLSEIERQRLIDAEWQGGAQTRSSEKYSTEIKIYGNNRTGLLVDITKIFTERGIDINSINSRTSKKGIATIEVSFYTKGKDELSMLGEKIRQIESVFDIERTTG